MSESSSKVLVDDERVFATHWIMPPGSKTGHHTHGRDYIVIYLSDGVLTVDTGSAEIQAKIEKHAVTSRPAGIEHNVMNKSEDPVEFIEIELK